MCGLNAFVDGVTVRRRLSKAAVFEQELTFASRKSGRAGGCQIYAIKRELAILCMNLGYGIVAELAIHAG